MTLRRLGILIAGTLIVATCSAWHFFKMPTIERTDDAESYDYGRIVSLAPSFTETLIALGESKRLVGVTAHCPAINDASPIAVGSFANPSLETILSLRPDLVLLIKHPGTQSIAMALANANIKVYAHEAESLDDIFSINHDVATLLNIPKSGQALNEKITRNINQAFSKMKKFTDASFLIFFGHHPLVAASPSTYPGEVFKQLGLKNMVTENTPRWPIWPLEKLLTWPPDFILIAEGLDAWPIYEKIFLSIWPQGKSPAMLVPEKPVLISPTARIVEDLSVIVECFTAHPRTAKESAR